MSPAMKGEQASWPNFLEKRFTGIVFRLRRLEIRLSGSATRVVSC